MRENLDRRLWRSSTLLCGVDEVGRGALAGPVVACAIVLRPGTKVAGADDSKLLSPARRARLDSEIRARCLSFSLATANHVFIDRYNIRVATFHAMRLAVNRLQVRPNLVIADGWAIPDLDLPCEGLVDGDRRSISIACASIVAKVWRDGLMERFSRCYPGYAFEKHKGYGTPQHLRALRELGPSPVHRRSFAPVGAAA